MIHGWLYKDFVLLYEAAMIAMIRLKEQIITGAAQRAAEYDILVTQLERLGTAASVSRIEVNGHISGNPEAARDQEIDALHGAGLDLARHLNRAAQLLHEGRDREALHTAEQTNLQMALVDSENECRALAEDVHALRSKVKDLEEQSERHQAWARGVLAPFRVIIDMANEIDNFDVLAVLESTVYELGEAQELTFISEDRLKAKQTGP